MSAESKTRMTEGSISRKIIRNGVPSGFQNSVISIANVFVQTNINAFGKMAMTTFVSQNLGAKQYDRAKKGARFGILCSIMIAELIGVVIYTAAPTLIPDIRVIFWAYPLTWSISSAIFLYLFLRGKWAYGFEKGGKR